MNTVLLLTKQALTLVCNLTAALNVIDGSVIAASALKGKWAGCVLIVISLVEVYIDFEQMRHRHILRDRSGLKSEGAFYGR